MSRGASRHVELVVIQGKERHGLPLSYAPFGTLTSDDRQDRHHARSTLEHVRERSSPSSDFLEAFSIKYGFPVLLRAFHHSSTLLPYSADPCVTIAIAQIHNLRALWDHTACRSALQVDQ